MTKRPPTRRQHVELGADLQDARAALLAAVVLTGEHYPQASKTAKAARTALDALDHLRSVLDDASASELHGDAWSPTIYYGENREVRAKWLAENPLDDDRDSCHEPAHSVARRGGVLPCSGWR